MNFWQRSSVYSPILCRLMAKTGSRPATAQELAGKSMKPHPLGDLKIEMLSGRTSWMDISIDDMRSFLLACEMDFCNPAQMHRADEYLRNNPTFRYLRTAKDWKDYYQPMLLRWRRSYGKVTEADTHLWQPLRKLLITITPPDLK